MNTAARMPRWLVYLAFAAGSVVGFVGAGFLFYAVLPPELILRDVPPRSLKYDPQAANPDYRDVYVARVARQFVRLGGANSELATQEALVMLGVASGDATLQQAQEMVSHAARAVESENARPEELGNPDLGRFTLADLQAINQLRDRLATLGNVPVQSADTPAQARQRALLVGGLLWLLFLLAAGAGLTFVHGLVAAPQPRIIAAPQQVTAVPPAPRAEVSEFAAPRQPSPATVTALDEEPAPAPADAPIQRFTVEYAHGDENFDIARDISSSTGEMLGECAVVIADRFGFERPERVIALAISVFDKNDFQTFTKVLVTPFAYTNPAISKKLSERGALVLARPEKFEVTTTTLRVEIEVSELRFGRIDDQPAGYFEHARLEFKVYRQA
ncbi:MAG: hypothetical protein NZ693_01205 [Thermoflexales bacterium]|nr:hypothetical protein [Thermoflexales bacterium]